MTKIIISLLLIASLAGILADAAGTAAPGDMLYPFKVYINDNAANALCAMSMTLSGCRESNSGFTHPKRM